MIYFLLKWRNLARDVMICVVIFLAVCVGHWIYKWRHPSTKGSGKLPPGSFGLPIVGETLSFFSPYASIDVAPFVKERVARYGPIFKTSLVGEPIIISTDPELNYFIFQQEGRLFQSWYPASFFEVFGRRNMANVDGFMYKTLKCLVLSLFGPEHLKKHLLPEIEQFAIKTLRSWSFHPSIELKEETSNMIFSLTANKLIGYDPDKFTVNLRENFNAFIDGLISFPINIPGTTYYKCMQGRNNAMKVLKAMLKERRASHTDGGQEDFFDHIIKELDKEETLLTEDMALDLMFVLLFASYETTSLALTMGIKLLSDHPEVLARMTEEHQMILINREIESNAITWTEYKSMTFTSHVINETLRLANIAPGIFRKAMVDIKTKGGYTIPEGWGIMVCPPAIHMNPNIYEDPFTFNPWRWEGTNSNDVSKNFMAFGGGLRFCVGADFSKLQMTVFLHYLITKYRWAVLKGGECVRTPGLKFPNGLHIRLTKKDD